MTTYPILFKGAKPLRVGDLPESAFHDPISAAKWAIAKQVLADILSLDDSPRSNPYLPGDARGAQDAPGAR